MKDFASERPNSRELLSRFYHVWCSGEPRHSRKSFEQMARLKGLEPLTLGSEDRCSVQLSYRRAAIIKGTRNCLTFFPAPPTPVERGISDIIKALSANRALFGLHRHPDGLTLKKR